MIKQYKEFFLSQELIDITPYAESIIEDDVEAFAQAFEPYVDEDLMIDPIEICAAYNSEAVFNYLITTFDYTDYFNPFRLSLPMILIVFERENLLFDALEKMPFTQEQLLMMYEFMLQTKDPEYFIEYYKAFGIDTSQKKDLLKYALAHPKTFEFLLKQRGFKKYLIHEDIVFEIVAYQQGMLQHITHIEDLSKDFDMEAFVPVLRIEDKDLFKTTIDFITERNLDLNTHNEFGLTFFHEALRHAVHSDYIYYLQEKGANPFFKTTRGYQSSHQLLFRDAQFTLDLARIIDFEAKDLFGLMLKDYDALQRKQQLQLLDVLLIVKLVLNMDESAIYELDNAEYYDLSSIHGVDPFINAYSVAVFENEMVLERFKETFGRTIQLEDINALQESLGESFIYDEATTLEIIDDIIALEEEEFEAIAEFTKTNNTTIKLTTDGVDINKVGHVEITIDHHGTILKQAHIHSNLIDVYYIHTYYDVPLEDIVYTPLVSKTQRFLN